MKFFKRKKKIMTALEIDGGKLKIVQSEFFGKTRKINKVIAEEIVSSPDSRDEKISARIKDLFKGLNIEPDSVIIIASYQTAIIRNLEFPSIDSAEIKNMVELQISKQTPFAADEIIYDYTVLSINAEGYSRVLLSIVHQDVIKRYFKILKAAKVKVERVALSSEGLFAWYRFAHQERPGDEPYVLINVDFGKSNFTVILKDKLTFCRNIFVEGLESLSGAQEWQEKLVSEIKHSIYAYRNEVDSKEVDKIVITGAEALTASLNEDFLKDKLTLAVEIIPQFENIPEAGDSLGRDNSVIKNISLASLLGFALTADKPKINLIPLQLRLEKGLKERGKDLYLFGVCLAAILMIISSIFLGKVYNKKQYLARLKEETLKIQDKANKLSGMQKEIEGVKKRIVKRDFALNCIYEIHKIIFPEIYLTAISSDGESQVILRGVSSAMSEVFDFLNALEKSECFQNVKTKFVTTRKIGNKVLTEFEIVCPLGADFRKELIEDK